MPWIVKDPHYLLSYFTRMNLSEEQRARLIKKHSIPDTIKENVSLFKEFVVPILEPHLGKIDSIEGRDSQLCRDADILSGYDARIKYGELLTRFASLRFNFTNFRTFTFGIVERSKRIKAYKEDFSYPELVIETSFDKDKREVLHIRYALMKKLIQKMIEHPKGSAGIHERVNYNGKGFWALDISWLLRQGVPVGQWDPKSGWGCDPLYTA